MEHEKPDVDFRFGSDTEAECLGTETESKGKRTLKPFRPTKPASPGGHINHGVHTHGFSFLMTS